MSGLACRGCGTALLAAAPAPYTCPNAGNDGGDHVMGRTLDASRVRFPASSEQNPFLRYRALTHAYSLASSRGLADEAFTKIVRDLDTLRGAGGRLWLRGDAVR